MHTKTKTLFFSALLILPLTTLAGFNDVFKGHDNYDGVRYVQEQGIVQGYEDGTYRPAQSINRAELTKIVVESNFSESEIESCTRSYFSDVDQGAWFASHVCVAAKNDIVGGYPDGTFRPARNVNLAEASKIILKSFGKQISTGSDVWFRPFIQALAKDNAIPTSIVGYDSFLTRGEMAEMIYRLKSRVRDKASQEYHANGLQTKSTPRPPMADQTPTEDSEDTDDVTTENTIVVETETEVTVETEAETQDESESEENITEEATTSTEENDEAQDDEESSEPTIATGNNVQYTPYSESLFQTALSESRPIALFFHAEWCPNCRALDTELVENLEQLPSDSLVLKVDFDTQTDLRTKYKVTQQHTAVIFNSQGQKGKSVGFSFTDLQAGLQ